MGERGVPAVGPATHRVGGWEFDLAPTGDLGHLRHDGTEVLRGVQFVVRDDAWGTIPGERVLTVETTEDDVDGSSGGLDCHLRATFGFPEGALHCEALLRVRADRLSYSFDAIARGRVSTNRIGLVVLHPLTLAGSPVSLRHPDGSASASAFPARIAPHQPFRRLVGLAHPVPARRGADAEVEIDLDGDVFETEDQRNWSDASFKTYSRPLELPFPYELVDGERVRQSVGVRVGPGSAEGAGATGTPRAAARTAEPLDLEPDWSSLRPRPAIGAQLGPDDLALEPGRLDHAAEALGLDHLRVDVVATSTGLLGAEALVDAGGRPLELALHLGDRPEAALGELARLLGAEGCSVAQLLVFDGGGPTTREGAVGVVRTALGDATATAPIRVGTDDNLAELNRTPPPVIGAVGVTFALTPQVHDTADRAVLETVEAVPAMVETARLLAGAGARVGIGALTLRPRRVIYRPGAIDRLGRDAGAADPRQHTDFAAAWLTATLAALIEAGADRVTVCELTGARGLAGQDGLHPIGAAVAALTAATEVGAPRVDLADDVALIPLLGPAGRSVLVADLSATPREFRLAGRRYSFSPYQTRLLPEGSLS